MAWLIGGGRGSIGTADFCPWNMTWVREVVLSSIFSFGIGNQRNPSGKFYDGAQGVS